MASDKFGSNPAAPLYNATGRNPRDVEMGTSGKALGSVGSSGAGGKDFGTPNQAPKQTNISSTSSFFSPFNPYNVMGIGYSAMGAIGRGRGRGRGGGGGGGGGEGEIDVEATERLWRAAPSTTVNFGDATGGDDSSVGKRASTGGGDILGSGSKAGRDQYTGNTQKTEVASSGAPRTRTPEQKAATKAKREEKKAANPAYNTKNPNRPPKADSPIKKTTNPAGPKKGNNVTQVQEMGAMKQKSTVGGNF